jgi:hypothetical protein
VDAGVGQHASISFSELVTASRKKYQNMVAQGEYGKLDAKSTQIMALILCSRLMVEDADADAICADICSQVKD